MTFFHASPEVIKHRFRYLEIQPSFHGRNYHSAKRGDLARMHKAKVVKVVIPLSPSLLLLPEDMIPPHPYSAAEDSSW